MTNRILNRLYLFCLPMVFLISCAPLQQSRQSAQSPMTAQNGHERTGSRTAQAEGRINNVTSRSQGAAGTKAGQGVSGMDISRDLTQPLEKEVTETPPETGSFATTALDKEARKALQSEPEISFELDIKETKTLEYYFQYYTQKNHESFQRWLKRAEPFLPYIRKVFTEKGLPQDLVFLPFAESGFNPWAYSRTGAAGLWQFIPSTARMFDLEVDWWLDERRDPYLATQAAAEFLSQLYERFGDWYLALAAYNCGGGNISRALKKAEGATFFDISRTKNYLPRETRNYIPKFLAILKIVRNLESLGFDPISWEAPVAAEKLNVEGGTDLLALTRHLGLDWDQFRHANPAFRRMAAPPYKSCPVYLDPSLLARAESFLKSREATPYAGFHRYRVRKGDSWWRLSRRYQIPIQILKKTNQTSSNLLRSGEWILIPGSGGKILAGNTSSPSGSSKTYRVRQGDSLWKISRRFGLSLDSLCRANNIASRERSLRIGLKLLIPGLNKQQKRHVLASKRSNYTIQAGDNLWSISRRFDISLQTLLTANELRKDEILQAGTKLYIPDITPGQTRQTRQRAQSSHRKIIEYYVQKGDNLWNISNRFEVSLKTLLAANDLGKGEVLHIGKQLSIPVTLDSKPVSEAGSGTAGKHRKVVFHTIRQGDSLWSIARRYEVSIKQLRTWNGIGSGNLLRPGDSLKILIN